MAIKIFVSKKQLYLSAIVCNDMGRNKTTIRDIAKALNITASTVSRALNNHPGISDATRKAVQATAKKLHYRPNHIAAALRSGRSNIIGVLVPSADKSIFPSVIRGIEEEVNRLGYSVIVGQTYENAQQEARAIDTMLRTRVDGIIVSIAKGTNSFDHLFRIRQEGIPLVLFDNTVGDLGVSIVKNDDFHGAYLATEHLILGGRKRIAHLFGPRTSEIYRERLRGYTVALNRYGIPANPDLLVDCPSDVQAGQAVIGALLDKGIAFDAIFSSSDYAALGAIQQLKTKNISVPEQVAIVGFGNAPFTSYLDPAISTVDQNGLQMGQCAARVFLEQIKQGENYIIRQHILQPQLIIRASSPKTSNETSIRPI